MYFLNYIIWKTEHYAVHTNHFAQAIRLPLKHLAKLTLNGTQNAVQYFQNER